MHETIPFSQTGLLPKIVSDYLHSAESLSSFYQYQPNRESITAAIAARKNYVVDRALLAKSLTNQYAGYQLADAVKINIDRLAAEHTFTVTTAHQPNLLCGPLYLIHKIASIIKVAQELNATLQGAYIVPVFWMGTEDHDKEELAHIHLFGKKISWNTSQKGAFGRFRLHDIDSFKQEVFDILGADEKAHAVQRWLEKHYFQYETISQATRGLLNDLFGDYGLIIIDGDTPELKQAFSPVLLDELRNGQSAKRVQETMDRLRGAQYNIQAVPRAINLFYLTEGGRSRIQKIDNMFIAGDQTFTSEELIREVQSYPERFSPNVMLRPLYQAMLLPDIMIAGGAAEVAYHLQLKTLFESYRLHVPMLMLRDMAIYTNIQQRQRLDKYGFTVSALFRSASQLADLFIHKYGTTPIDIISETDRMNNIYASLLSRAEKSDPTLKGFVEAEHKKAIQSLEAIRDKMRKSEKRKLDEGIKQIVRIKDTLMPGDVLHERIDNFLPYYMIHGSTYIQTLIQAFHIWDQQLKVVHFD
ncbi:putative cysteine ligase BshC [Bacteroidota bacterium]|nr:putative cysteine ligase BshC [Bacteroidota bacterium]